MNINEINRNSWNRQAARHINPSDPEQELENKYPRIMVFKVTKDK